ncbi:hypothetical protein SAMD00024442_25_38 [Candidatus Symbiothrix dinenymphae]|nr:hypothetical protein SAMD00024442_25_38 [Candidatus Symbiothrix dinenymphae]
MFGKNFIGQQELQAIAENFPVAIPRDVPAIPYAFEELKAYAADYILVLGAAKTTSGEWLNLLSLREKYGIHPDVSEPCFYNQDWYLQEDFMETTLENKWYLIRKNVFEDSRAEQPSLLEKKHAFPSAILCAYIFFAYWFCTKETLWQYDFVWCNCTDHNGDRIYVGKYHDIDGVNKNGFSIHRHLALRRCYGAVDALCS